MTKLMYCYDCDKNVDPIEKYQTNNYNVRGNEVTVNEIVFYCPNCGLELIDECFEQSSYNIYNAYLNLFDLSFEKLKEIRESLNLSQSLFSKAMGWSKKTIVRYENAQSIPQGEYLIAYQKLANNKNEIFAILANNKDKIGGSDYYNIINRINAELDIKTINVFLYILKNKILSTTQIMKYFFALDFESKKRYDKPITTLTYAHCTYGPIINNQDAYLNLLIQQGFLKIQCLFDKEGTFFKANKECDLKLFNQNEIEIMDKVLQKFEGKKAKELSDWSHEFIGWQKTKNGEIIDYNYAKDFDLNNGW